MLLIKEDMKKEENINEEYNSMILIKENNKIKI